MDSEWGELASLHQGGVSVNLSPGPQLRERKLGGFNGAAVEIGVHSSGQFKRESNICIVDRE
jgi:hypothetical protein